jgi:hypothetical protein
LLTSRAVVWFTPRFADAPARVTRQDLKALEGTLRSQIANITWALADESTAKRVLEGELERVYGAEGPAVAELYFRAALLDPSPDGRRALINYGCVAHVSACDDIPAALRRQSELRQSATPDLPPGHPPLGGLSGKDSNAGPPSSL